MFGFSIKVNAQEPISFRSNALGGVIDDYLDLVYDPIELRFVDGVRIYTNLSNLTSSQEKLFNNISDDEFLFGMSSENPFLNFLSHSALIRFQNSETSNSVGIDSDLDGYTDITGNGTLIDEYTAYLDTDYDGLFDLKNMLSQEKSSFTTDDSYSFILNNSLELWILVMGVKLSMGNSTHTGNMASTSLGSADGVLSGVNWDDPTFSRSVITYLIEDEYDNLTWSEDGVFNSENNISFTNWDISVMVDLFDFEFRTDLAVFSNQTLSNFNDDYSGQYEYFDPGISSYADNYSETDSYFSKTDEDGGGFAFGGSLRKIFEEMYERKNDGYWEFGGSASSGSYDYTDSTSSQFSSIETYFDGLNTNNTDFVKTNSEQSAISDVGTKKFSKYNFFGRLNIPIGENVYFGIGGYLNQSTINRETDYTESVNNVTDYNYTDSDYDDIDYITTITSQLTADRNYDLFNSTFIWPVGLEYKLGGQNKWSLRFGSIFTSTYQTINDAKQVTDAEPYVTETEYGNGDVTIDFDNNIFESISEHTRTASSSTVFTYGLGYNPTKNLQIDMLGIGSGDLEFDGVRLSFSVKF